MPAEVTIEATIMRAMDEDGTELEDGGWIVHLYRYVKAGICCPWGEFPIDYPDTEHAEAALAAHGYQLAGKWDEQHHRDGGRMVVNVETIPRPVWTPPAHLTDWTTVTA